MAGCLSGYTYPSPSPAPQLSFPSSSPAPSITYASTSKYSQSEITQAKSSEEKYTSSQSPSSKYAAVATSSHGYPTSSGLSDYTTSDGVSSYVKSDKKPGLEYLPPVQKTKVVVSQPQPAIKYSSTSAVSESYSTSAHDSTKLEAVGPAFVPVAPAAPVYKTHYVTAPEPVVYAVQANPNAHGAAYVSKTITNSQAESSAYYNSEHTAEQKVVVAQQAPTIVQYATAPAALTYAETPAVTHYAQVQPSPQYISAPQTVHYAATQAEGHYQAAQTSHYQTAQENHFQVAPSPHYQTTQEAVQYAVPQVAVQQQAPTHVAVAPAVTQVVHKQATDVRHASESHAAQYSSGQTAVTHYATASADNQGHEGHVATAVQYVQPAPVAIQQQPVAVQQYTVAQPAQYLVGPPIQEQYVTSAQPTQHYQNPAQGLRYAATVAPQATVYAAPVVQKQVTSTIIKPVVTKHAEYYVS